MTTTKQVLYTYRIIPTEVVEVFRMENILQWKFHGKLSPAENFR